MMIRTLDPRLAQSVLIVEMCWWEERAEGRWAGNDPLVSKAKQ